LSEEQEGEMRKRLRWVLLGILVLSVGALAYRWTMFSRADEHFSKAVHKWNVDLYRSMPPGESCAYALDCLKKAEVCDPWVASRHLQLPAIRKYWQKRQATLGAAGSADQE